MNTLDQIKLLRHKFNTFLGGKIIKYLDIDKHGLSFTIDATIDMFENASKDFEIGLSKTLDESILSHKRGDTIFILGSGPSIADIDDETWRRIRDYDSIGFNYSLLQEHVPTFYLLQDDGVGIKRAIQHQKDRYAAVPILYRNTKYADGRLDWDSPELSNVRNNIVYSICEYPISDTSDISPYQWYRFLEIQGLLCHGKIGRFIPKFRCSLGLLLSLSFQMGYKNIVLCGMDMQSNKHFWNDPRYAYLHKIKELTIPSDAPINRFTDKDQIGITVPEYVVSFADWARSRANVAVSVLSKRTVLYPDLPLYSFN